MKIKGRSLVAMVATLVCLHGATSNASDRKEITPFDSTKTYWVYENDVDEMSGDTSRVAKLDSKDIFKLTFPFEQWQYGKLIITNDKGRYYVLIMILEGIIHVPFEGDYIRFRFDNNPEQKFYAKQYAGSSKNLISIYDSKESRKTDSFMEALKHAKRMKVELPIYENPSEILTFYVNHFEPPAK